MLVRFWNNKMAQQECPGLVDWLLKYTIDHWTTQRLGAPTPVQKFMYNF